MPINRNRRVKIYVRGRGFVDIAKTVLTKLISTAAAKGAEVAGDRIGSFAATKLADKVIPTSQPAQKPSNNAIKAIEDLEARIKRDIDKGAGFSPKVTGKGFKIIR